MITTLDALQLPPRPKVRDFPADHEDPGAATLDHLASLDQPWPYCVFANPRTLITCTEATKELFTLIRSRQARWCRQSRNTFGATCRKTRTWISPYGPLPKTERFLQRALCFTGVLFIDGDLIQPHRWREFEPA